MLETQRGYGAFKDGWELPRRQNREGRNPMAGTCRLKCQKENNWHLRRF